LFFPSLACIEVTAKTLYTFSTCLKLQLARLTAIEVWILFQALWSNQFSALNALSVEINFYVFFLATPYADGDVVVKTLGRFKSIAFDFRFGSPLENVALCVIPYPPITGRRDFENYKFSWVARNPCDGVLNGYRPVTLC